MYGYFLELHIVTTVLLLEKAVYPPGTTSLSSRNLAPVGENSKLQPLGDKNFRCFV